MRSRRTIVVLVAAALAVASCAGSDAADTVSSPGTATSPVTEVAQTDPPATDPPATQAPVVTDPPNTTAPAETDPPTDDGADIELGDGFGQYDVGVKTITIADASGGDRNLTVDVWFPLVDGAAADLPAQQYTLFPGSYYESPQAVAATPDDIATDGPFPLVVYSHGSGGLRYIHSNYTEAIASHGYIVAAPDHIGNTAVERLTDSSDEQAVIAFNRPNDVTKVIDAFLNPESTETVGFVGSINPGQIAVTGHSFGGFTAYAVASGFSNEIGEYVADERVGAIIALAPAASERLLSDELLMSIDIPALVMVGTDDKTTPVDPNVTRPWELTSSAPSYRVDLVAAEHQTFTDVCAYVEYLPTLPDVLPAIIDTINVNAEEGCAEGDMPIERAQAITNTFATTFLDSIFKGGEPIDLLEVDEQADFVYQVK